MMGAVYSFFIPGQPVYKSERENTSLSNPSFTRDIIVFEREVIIPLVMGNNINNILVKDKTMQLTTKQAKARAKTFYVTLSTAKSNFQSLFKDLVESWDTTRMKNMKASKNTTARIRIARQILQSIKVDITRGYKPCKSEVKELKEFLSSARIGLRQDMFNNYYKQLKNKEL